MKYNFCVERDETPYYHLIEDMVSDLYNLKSHKYVLKIKTNVKVENDKIYIFFNKENAKNIYGKDIQNWKYGSFRFQNREVNIKEIQSIEYKNCFLLSFVDLILSLFLFVMVLWFFYIEAKSMVSAVQNLGTLMDFSAISPLILVDLIIIGLLIFWTSKLKFRSLKINIKNDKPIIIPYRKVLIKHNDDIDNICQLERLINQLKSYGIDVKGKLK